MAREDPDTLIDHWWWRPGWRVGTRYYAWHLLLDEQPELTGLVARFRSVLSGFDVLDPIPEPWLHITLQGVGFVEDVTAPELTAVTSAVTDRVVGQAIDARFREATIFGEGVVLVPEDQAPFHDLLDGIQAGLRSVRGRDAVPEAGHDFVPHLTVAYASGSCSTAPIRRAVDTLTAAEPVRARFARVSLIRMHRDRRMYEWDVIDRVDLD